MPSELSAKLYRLRLNHIRGCVLKRAEKSHNISDTSGNDKLIRGYAGISSVIGPRLLTTIDVKTNITGCETLILNIIYSRE